MSTIEDMARESGINFEPAREEGGIDTWYGNQYLPDGALARFAALVRAKALDEAHAAVQDVLNGDTSFDSADYHLEMAQKRILMLKESA